jgi:DNA-binding transcriptional LysR family regulator
MDTLSGVRLFVRVAEAGSFTKAAALASVTNSQLTRAIAELEARLRTRLPDRTTRRISLTGAGDRYLQRCEQILANVDEAESEARGTSVWPSGRSRVHTSTSFGQHYSSFEEWVFEGPDAQIFSHKQPVALDVNVAEGLAEAIREGIGVGPLPLPAALRGIQNGTGRLAPRYGAGCDSRAGA